MARPCPMIRGQADRSQVAQRHPETPAEHPEDGVVRGHPEVAPQRQLDPSRHGESLDGGDDRLGQGQAGRAHRPRPVVGDGAAIAFGHRLEVRPGAEGPLGAGEDGHRLRRVLIEVEERLAQLVGAEAVHRVAPLGPGDLHDGDRTVAGRPRRCRSGRGCTGAPPFHSRTTGLLTDSQGPAASPR